MHKNQHFHKTLVKKALTLNAESMKWQGRSSANTTRGSFLALIGFWYSHESPDRLTLKFNTRHDYIKNIGEILEYSFFEIIDEDFKYSVLFELKQPDGHLVVYPHEVQDGH